MTSLPTPQFAEAKFAIKLLMSLKSNIRKILNKETIRYWFRSRRYQLYMLLVLVRMRFYC